MSITLTLPRYGIRHDATTAARLRSTSLALFTRHNHAGYWDALTRENCGACALAGYGASTDEGRAALQPNYAGWARAYVEAGEAIPSEFRDGFAEQLADVSNVAYSQGLADDIATYGVSIGRPTKGRVVSADVLAVDHRGVSTLGNGIWELTTSAGTFRTRQGSSYLTSSDVKRWAGRAAALYVNGRGTVYRIA